MLIKTTDQIGIFLTVAICYINKFTRSTKSTTESASIDSDKFILGKAFSLTFGATGSIGMNAEQQTRDEESIALSVVDLVDESVLSSVKSTPLDFHHPVVAFS
jgi:hypothetical protein